jgi:hypothetical protein
MDASEKILRTVLAIVIGAAVGIVVYFIRRGKNSDE